MRRGGSPQQSRVGDGDLRAAFGKTSYLRVITGVIFHLLPSPVPLQQQPVQLGLLLWGPPAGASAEGVARVGLSGSAPLLH